MTSRDLPDDELAVGRTEEFPIGSCKVVDVEGREIGVLRTASDRFYAVRNVCPHKSAPVCRGAVTGTMLPSSPGTLEYGMEESVLRCPWHGWEFDIASGEALFSVSRLRLRTYAVVVRDGQVHIRLPHRARDGRQRVTEGWR